MALKYPTLSALFTAIGNSLRSKTGSTGKIVADDFPSVIDSLSTGGITPSGTKNITTNGTHDVTSYASANVNVPIPSGYIKPSGTKNITTNGTHDVTNFASATVNVPTGITPSGSKTITENGTYDVTNYASAVVAVPEPEQICVVRTVTVASTVTGANTEYKLLTGDAFIKKHYADAGFSVTLICMSPVAAGTNIVHFGYQGNRNVGSSNQARYGFGIRSTNTSTVAFQPFTAKINGTGYTHHMRVNSSGNLIQFLYKGYVLPAGTYQIILTCTT